jgi:hypothetical protein
MPISAFVGIVFLRDVFGDRGEAPLSDREDAVECCLEAAERLHGEKHDERLSVHGRHGMRAHHCGDCSNVYPGDQHATDKKGCNARGI